jgi:hypothetical protein
MIGRRQKRNIAIVLEKKLIKCGIFIDLRMTHLNILLCHAYGSRFV